MKLLLDLIIEQKTLKNVEILTDENKLYFTISIALYSNFFKNIKSGNNIYKTKVSGRVNGSMILKSIQNKLNRTKYCIADKPDFLKNTVKIYLAE